MIDLPKIEELEISVFLPEVNSARFVAFQTFLSRFNDKVQNEGVSIKLDFKIAYNGELCAYYEDEYEYAFYFDDYYLRSLIKEHGTMTGAIQSFDGDNIFHMKFGLKVFPKELAKKILSSTFEEYIQESQEYEPHFEIFGLADEKRKTIKNSNILLSIVGMQYHDKDSGIYVGAELTIKPDYGNVFDDQALGYYTKDGTLVGYVPRREQAFVRLFFTEGKMNATVYNISDRFVDTVVYLRKSMADRTKTSGLGFMKITKEKRYGTYTEGMTMCSFEDIIDSLN